MVEFVKVEFVMVDSFMGAVAPMETAEAQETEKGAVAPMDHTTEAKRGPSCP